MKTSVSRKLAQILLNTKAVKLSPQEPFKWSSGWNSPIYCDNRVTLSYPEERSFIKTSLAERIQQDFPDCEAIAGVATAGIAQGALVAEHMGLPFLYVRPEPKKHGMKNTVEGRVEKGQKVVLIEDLISTGGSSIKAAKNVQAAGAEVLGIVAAVTYGFATADFNFEEADITLSCLCHYSDIISEAIEMGYVSQDDLSLLEQWREDPSEWGDDN